MHQVLDKLGYIAGWVSGDQLAINEGHRTELLGNARVSFLGLYLYSRFFLNKQNLRIGVFLLGCALNATQPTLLQNACDGARVPRRCDRWYTFPG